METIHTDSDERHHEFCEARVKSVSLPTKKNHSPPGIEQLTPKQEDLKLKVVRPRPILLVVSSAQTEPCGLKLQQGFCLLITIDGNQAELEIPILFFCSCLYRHHL